MIGLPPNLFYGTGIPSVILVFDKSRTARGVTDVLFIDASREFGDESKQNKLRDEDLDKITATFLSREDVEKYAHVTTPEEIAENDYNLNIPRYVDTFEEEEPIDLAEVKEDIERIESELVEVRSKMDEYLSELGL